MQQIYMNGGFRGYTRLMKYISNIAHLGAKHQAVVRYRLKVIEHMEKYGKDSCKNAFGVAKSTVYLWRAKVANSGGLLSALKPGDTTPKCKRTRTVDGLILEFIRQYRGEHQGVGKTTVKSGLDAYCTALGLVTVSESTVGRVISDLKAKGQIPNFTVTTTINGKTGNLKSQGKETG